MSDEISVRDSASADAVAAAVTSAAKAVEQTLEAVTPRVQGLHGRVVEAMRYATFAGGKRLRPYIILASARLFGASEAGALRAAAAIEMVHTYSLVHDDLPCMDDDDLRRGRPTTHRQFDEATAVLAGDALLTLAFEILAAPETHPSAETRIALVGQLARAAGAEGMVGGQMMDIESETRQCSAEDVVLLQRMKTGALFEFSAVAGPILAGRGAEDQQRMRRFAQDFGLAFQIADDLIDATGTAEAAGKAVGKDDAKGKSTMVSIHGIEGARREARRLADRAAEGLSVYGAAADELRGLPYFLLDRAS
ncbi:MAG: polyprenyl synthetase family protein [Caulobacteraceae bacterium]|nr:polyprenyl synthetase family protein [Caulobacteraceae bacterium]